MKVERQSNIELLRILAIMGVIVLHYGNPSIGGGLSYVKEGSINSYVLYLLISLFACAVDLFMIISGYFMCNSKAISLWKPLKLIIQVIAFRIGLYLFSLVISGGGLSIKTLLGRFIPANYFVILYCTVYVLSPFINVLFEKLSLKSLKQLMICCFLLFSVYPTMVDVLSEFTGKQFLGLSSIGMYGSQWGYSVINFMLMYMIGAYIRKCDFKINFLSSNKLFAFLGVFLGVLFLWARMNDITGFFTEKSAWEYCNPILILEAITIFILFRKMHIGVKGFINRFAGGAFTVFLLHDRFIRRIGIEHYVNDNVIIMILHIIVSVVAIYFICFLVYIIYDKIENKVFSLFSQKIKLPLLKIESR